MARLGLAEPPPVAASSVSAGAAPAAAPAPVFTTERERQAARVVMDVIGKYEVKRDLVPTSSALLTPEVQSAILAEVTERLKPAQGELLAEVDDAAPALDLSAVVSKTTEIVVQQTIDIPRIAVVPTGEVTTGFHPFKLGSLPNFQPGQREIVGQELRTNHQFTMSREAGIREQRFEDYIVKKLIDYDDIDYFTQAELLYDLAGQAVAHYQAQNYSENELHEVFDTYGAELARLIRAEMMAHFWEEATDYEVQVSRGFTELKPCNYTAVADLPHQPWLAQPEFALDQLAERLQTYQSDCRQLLELDDLTRRLLGEIHAGGLTKYQFVGDPEDEITRLVEFAHHLPQEAEALEKKVRSAVVNVAACLRELRDGLAAFKRRMREFNRKISGRQLSDLAVFKIEPEDESALVEAIELLISTAATVGNSETFELFNQQSVLDDDQLNRAKTLLIEEGNARHGLRVADLFRLRFWVGKAGREPEAFDDLDSAASNGTVLMAKLVTGLAMLHLMQDQRRPIQGICYLDEALALDARNQRSLIETAAEFGFSLIFASPAPLTTVRYCVPIHHRQGSNQISRFSWQIIEPVEA